MTVAHDPAECRGLVAEALEQVGSYSLQAATMVALADQLEAACAEVDRLHDHDERRSDTVAKLDAECRELTAERDSMRQQLDAVGAEREEARAWCDRIKPVYEKLQSDLAAAQRRIAELEAALKGAEQEISDVREQVAPLAAQERIITLQIQVDGMRNTIHVILPVYRAAVAGWTKHGPQGRGGPGDCSKPCIKCAVDTARAAITPEIDDVLKQLENP